MMIKLLYTVLLLVIHGHETTLHVAIVYNYRNEMLRDYIVFCCVHSASYVFSTKYPQYYCWSVSNRIKPYNSIGYAKLSRG